MGIVEGERHTSRKAAMITPVLKLGTLALRTLSKPIASRLKHYAELHPKFRHFVVGIAQANHRISTTLQRRIYGRATDALIRPLDQERAVQAAADILGEVFLFTVAGALIIYEVQRNSRSEAKKEEKRRQEIEAMQQKETILRNEVQLLKLKLQVMEQLCSRSRTGSYDFVKVWHAQEKKIETPSLFN